MRARVPPHSQEIPAEIRRDAVEQQFDSINVLGEAVSTAIRDSADHHDTTLRIEDDAPYVWYQPTPDAFA